MAIRFPDISDRLGLGVGLDLHWGDAIGFQQDPRGRDIIAPGVVQFLQAHRARFAYLFVSWQPRSRNHLDASEYFGAYDDLFQRVPPWSVRALHHTALNLGAMEPYDRTALLALSNALIQRYGFSWVNEDLGLWSLNGKPLPYPLPPFLTDAGLAASIANTRQVQEGLDVPLLVEFPGFSEGASILVGHWHAYDYFRCLAEKKNNELTEKEITTYKLGLEKDLSDVHDAKDEEITHLKNEIENLKTKVEIETIRAEIYNLKMLAQQK